MSSGREQPEKEEPVVSPFEYYSGVRAEDNEQPGIDFLREALSEFSAEARKTCKSTEQSLLEDPINLDTRIALRALGFVLTLDEAKKLDPSIREQADERHDFNGIVSRITMLLAYVPPTSSFKEKSREAIRRLQILLGAEV